MSNPAPIGVDVLLIPARDAARMLSVSERTLWGITAPRGSLPCVRIGARCLYSPDALRAWIVAQEANPPPPATRPRDKASAST